MSRVSYAMMHDGRRRRDDAAPSARRSTGSLAQLAIAGRASSATTILELAIVGNPIMHHLLLGIDPIPLGSAPFALATDRAVRSAAARAGPPDPSRRPGLRPAVHRRPRRRRHGRRDPRRGAARSREVVELVVDVGTNAEIVLGNRDCLLAASSPTGPAFEGAQISRRPARRAGRDRAGPDRPRDAGAAVPGHRLGAAGRTSRASPRRPPRPASPGSAARASSRSIAELFLAGRHHRRRDDRRGARRAHAARSSPTAGRSPTSSTTARRRPARGSPSPRTTSGRSSSRRPRSTPASGC